MKHLLLLLPLYARRKGGLLLALFCALATVAAGVGLLGVSGWFLTGAALAGAGAAFNLFAPSALVRGLSFLRIVSRYADRLAGHSATLRLLADLRTLVFRALIRLTPRQLARYRGGDLVARMTGDVDALDTVFLFVLAPLATALLAGAIMTAVLGYWIPAAALVFALALLVACVLAPWGLQRAARGPGAAAQESAAGLRAAVLDAVDGHADMVALHAQAQTRAHFERLCGQNAQARQAQACVAARGLWFLQPPPARPCWVCCGSGWANTRAAACPGLCWRVCCWRSWAYSKWPRPSCAARRAWARRCPRRSASARWRNASRTCAIPTRRPRCRRMARWNWTACASPIPMAPWCWTASACASRRASAWRSRASGAGKSTLLHLILRLEDPQAGQVRYGGRDARDCAQADWHRRIALLSQDAPVFLGTLRTNLLIGDPSADEARCGARWTPRAWAISCAVCPTGWMRGRARPVRCCRPGRRGGCVWRGPCCRRPGCWCWTSPPPAWTRRPKPISCAIWGGRRRGAPWCWPRMRACRRARWTGAACCAGTVA